jgi:hypothetical protein
MFRAQDFLSDLERFLKERFGFGVLAHSLVQVTQVIKALGGVEMFSGQDLLPDLERFLEERFGFGVLAHGQVHLTQVIETGCRLGVFWPKNLLPDPERFLVVRFGFGVVRDLSEKEPEVFKGFGCLEVLSTPSALCHFKRSFRNGNRLLIFSLSNQLVNVLIQCIWIIVFGPRCRACKNPETKR